MEDFQIKNIDSEQYKTQNYEQNDITLLNPIEINKEFGKDNDIIEFHIFSPNNTILESNYNYQNYNNRNNIDNSTLFDTIEINPEKDLSSYGYNKGEFNVLYNFYRLLFSSSTNSKFFIKEISRDRTEIKISSNNILYSDLQQKYIEYITDRNSRNFYSDFILNFGENKTVIGVNIALDNNIQSPSSLYIKLYEPLPLEYSVKNELWIAEIISDSYSFQLNKDVIINNLDTSTYIKGPNFNIDINDRITSTTPYLNLSTILDNNITSSYNQLQSLIKDNIQINIDYNEFSNFIHFSSIKERIENYVFKLTQIQQLENDLQILSNISSSVDTGSINNSLLTINNKISNITQNFDGYEYFLHYNSGSNSFPKTTSEKPYINVNVTSSIALDWIGSYDEQSNYYGGKLLDAFNFDNENRDYIWNNLPEYIKEDPQNSQLELVISMMGQHFDYIWTYIKDITEKNIADNRLDYGVSKDLVAETLKSFGIKLYTNSRNNQNIYNSLLGINPDGTYLPSTGSYNINTYITSSKYTIPDNDINKETYKRIYHNLSYLLKTRGTNKGIRALINCFGIPETILNIKEFGGEIKDENFIEQKEYKFNYSLSSNNDSKIILSNYPSYKQFIDTGFDDIVADTLEFRFKLSNIIPTQSLLESTSASKRIILNHTSNSYGSINFSLKSGSIWIDTPSIDLPFYNNDWWNVNITRETGSLRKHQTGSSNIYTLTVGNKDEFGIQYYKSSSFNINGTTQSEYNKSWGANTIEFLGGADIFFPFYGELQEFRYWIGSLPEVNFKDHILNPKSISYINETGSYNNLIFRLPLGSELDTYKTQYLKSIHPSEYSSFIFNGVTSSTAILDNYSDAIYNNNYENYFINTPNGTSFIESNEKIKIIEEDVLSDNTLSPFVSIRKKPTYSQVKNSSKIEIGISAEHSINDDIIQQLGNFNIDDYIGDPKDKYKTYYPKLNDLKKIYFKKYIKKQNIFELIKLLSYIDNSLFKMVKDFIPAKSNLTSGLIIKPNILEINKTQQFEPVLESNYLETEINTAFITGSNGLDSLLSTNNIKQTTNELGIINIESTDNKELYNGEILGSEIVIHSQSAGNIIYEPNVISLDNSDIIKNYSSIPVNPILNNVYNNRKSLKNFDIDYSSNINSPVNINYLTSSLLGLDDNMLFQAEVQDSNYTLKRHKYPRYDGSKTISKEYNKYNIGDKSYGKSPNIENNPIKFGYFGEITSNENTLSNRSNVYLKYLIDDSLNITELTRYNKSLFDVQNIFNKGVDLILDDNLNPSNQKDLDGLKNIFAGGFRFEPILQNIGGTHDHLSYTYTNDISVANDGSVGGDKIELSPDSILIGTPKFKNPIITSLNTPSNYINTYIDTPIIFPIKRRNLSYTGEVKQRISGSISIKTYISPPSDYVTRLYSGVNYTGYQWTINGAIFRDVRDSGGDFGGPNANDNVNSVKIPAGVVASFYDNWYRRTLVITGPLDLPSAGSPLGNGNGGVDSVDIKILDCSTKISVLNQYNSFSSVIPITNLLEYTPPTGYSKTPFINSINNPLDITFDEEYGVELIFDIDGYITLPKNMNNADSELKTTSNNPGKISAIVSFQGFGGSKLRIKNSPQVETPLLPFSSSFYYGNSPENIYISNYIDNGFISSSTTNHFFERGTYIGGNSNILTASYDLSYMYNYCMNNDNSFTQTYPTFSNIGYETTELPFIPKIGDLIRFYNEDKNTFPIEYEREVIDIIEPINPPISSSIDSTNRLFIVLSDEISSYSCNDNTAQYPKQVQNFIFLSKIPDETNIVINASKKTGKTSPGIIIPSNSSKTIKDRAGNIIKQLKNQNLI